MTRLTCVSLSILMFVFACSIDDSNPKENFSKNFTQKHIDSLDSIINELETEIDILQDQLLGERREDWFLPSIHAKKMIQNGIEDPAKFIKSELVSRPDIIPMNPVLGGTMAFRRITILGSHWILAEYDDGHVLGRAIFTYQWEKEKGLTFKVMDSVNY